MPLMIKFEKIKKYTFSFFNNELQIDTNLRMVCIRKFGFKYYNKSCLPAMISIRVIR